MKKALSKYVFAFLVGGFLVGASVLPAAGSVKPENLGLFKGAASSHAVKISIGDLVLTVGGGESKAGYERVKHSPIHLIDRVANATARGVLIPGIADTKATCAPPTLSNKVAALATPESLQPLLNLQLGLASCALNGLTDLPVADHTAGEVVADVNLTQTVVKSVPAVNDFLDTVQGSLEPLPESLRGQVNTVIDAIQAKLSSAPLLTIKVAPNHGTVTSSLGGIASASPGTAVTIDVLGGLLQIEIASAEAAASVIDGKPAASADVAWVHVKALNILTPDPNDALIDQKISAPQNLNILAGTPLATTIATERGTTSTTCDGGLASFDACARGTADAVALKLLADPLPTIGVELVHTEVLSAGNFEDPSVKPVALPKTGAGAATAVVGGLGLVFGGVGLRRRLKR
jgi:hypothetical protein